MNFNQICPYLAALLLLAGGGCRASQVDRHDAAQLLRALATETRIWWYEVHQPVLARVGHRSIRLSDLDEAYKTFTQRNPPAQLAGPDGKRRLLETLINQQSLIVLAERRGLDREATSYAPLAVARRVTLVGLLRERLEAEEPVREEEVLALYRSQYPETPAKAARKGNRGMVLSAKSPPYESKREDLYRRISQGRWTRAVSKARQSEKVWIDPEWAGALAPGKSRGADK